MPQETPSRRPAPATQTPRARKRAASSKRAVDAGSAAHAAPSDDAKRREMIAVAAYYRAQRRGFAPGDAVADWVQAEAEIAERFPR